MTEPSPDAGEEPAPMTYLNIDEDPDVAAQIAAIENETSSELHAIYQKLAETQEDDIRAANLIRKYREETIKKMFASEFRGVQRENKDAKAELRKQMITELEIEREKCKEWYQNIKIDGSDGDVRETRQTRQKRKVDVLDAKAPEKVLKVPVVRDPKAAGPTVKYEVTNGELVADLTLLNDTRTGSKKRLTVKASDESENQVECFYEHKPVDMVNGKVKEATDRLWYNDRWYIRGTKITVEYADKEKETGHIMMFTAAVIWIAHIRKGEMAPFSKFHLRISELASKKYTMRLAQGREQ